jgi:hypothetical protein
MPQLTENAKSASVPAFAMWTNGALHGIFLIVVIIALLRS